MSFSERVTLVASTELILFSHARDRRKLRAHDCFGSASFSFTGVVGWTVSTAEHICYDPKDSELCLARVKPQETGVEARSRCDVQIHGVSWA